MSLNASAFLLSRGPNLSHKQFSHDPLLFDDIRLLTYLSECGPPELFQNSPTDRDIYQYYAGCMVIIFQRARDFERKVRI